MDNERSHPSWGLLSWRPTIVQPGAKERMNLFGVPPGRLSSEQVVHVELHGAYRFEEANTYFVSEAHLLASGYMTSTQFAVFAGSAGERVPITLDFMTPLGKGQIPSAPPEEDEATRIETKFTKAMEDAANEVHRKTEGIRALIARKQRLSQKDVADINKALDELSAVYRSTAPWALKRFKEAIARLVPLKNWSIRRAPDKGDT